MSQFIGAYEPIIRSTVFIGLFVILIVSEFIAPRSEGTQLKKARWFTNLSIFVIDIFVLRLLFKAAAVGIAVWAEASQIGLFHWLGFSSGLLAFFAGFLCFIALDFTVWASHVASHKIPILWRVHRMHHTDTQIDVTTALRFHPIEIVLSMLVKIAAIIILGAPAVAVIIFEIVLNGAAMFNHSNLKLPLKLDTILRKVIVTPDMHRIHHSTNPSETDSNYGFNLAFWDRWFGTYTYEAQKGRDDIQIGLNEFQNEKPSKIVFALKIPFIKS